MTVVRTDVCSNCRKEVPQECDGRVYRVSDWKRKVCRGSDGDSFEHGQFRIVRGHGQSWLVPLIEDIVPDDPMLGDMQRALFSLREENKALAVDAARYRWLREHPRIAVYTKFRGAGLDIAVDVDRSTAEAGPQP